MQNRFRLKVTVTEGYFSFNPEVADLSWYGNSVPESLPRMQNPSIVPLPSAAVVYMVLGGLHGHIPDRGEMKERGNCRGKRIPPSFEHMTYNLHLSILHISHFPKLSLVAILVAAWELGNCSL